MPTERAAKSPVNRRLYAIGDIHGCLEPLDRLRAVIVEDSRSAEGPCALVYLGDYIDRGPQSKGVIDRLMQVPLGFDAYFLRGNHDQALLDFLQRPATYLAWSGFGGGATLLSYGVAPPRPFDQASLVRARE